MIMNRIDIKRAYALVQEYENLLFVQEFAIDVHSNEYHARLYRKTELEKQMREMGVDLS